ncbi:MAG: diguanylate cyclase [Zoogloea oleivorans]|jgi:diguanylate cyclase|uniref:GGDEF domain-containing protein n=1 Tax=Zoogloea oleivorans TaxID=1552750 RepID=UPI002A364504|nr:diguanylate cyclase [Zoogloea oleivorans]MDY0036860.1 diguanylate cyclase [Zoogloea oleivorans]
MTDTSQPSDVARETLRQLAMRRIAPTPDNYRALYHEIAGSLAEEVFPERAFKQIAAALPRHNRESLRLAREFESAISQAEWPALRAVMADAFSRTEETNLNWGNLLRDLVSEWDRRQAGLTQARKREMLDRVLTASGGNPEKLFERMQGLLRAWSRNSDEDLPGNEAADSAEAVQTVAPTPRDTTSPLCTELLAGLLDGIAAQAKLTEPDLANEAGELAGMIRQGPALAPELVRQRLDKLRARLEWSAEDQHAVRDALQRVLQLILENISELVVDDRWLHGQIALMGEMFDHPLDVRILGELENRLRNVIQRQGAIKIELNDAQTRLKDMLARFVDRLGDFTESTGEYHDKIEQCAERISSAQDITQLTDVIAEVMRETRTVQETTRRSRSELEELRTRVHDANSEITRLQVELEQTSELIRHDPLTGVLNRKGLDEALTRETALARRRGTALCVGLLDVDNFKQINDNHGHQTGDEALQHLVDVVRENVRPQDSVARYGGEEFVVLLPDTLLDSAVATMVRLQRALTKRFFLTRQQKLLITFSAGVAEMHDGEAPEEALDRADKAMYIAKRSGKNRVIAAT